MAAKPRDGDLARRVLAEHDVEGDGLLQAMRFPIKLCVLPIEQLPARTRLGRLEQLASLSTHWRWREAP